MSSVQDPVRKKQLAYERDHYSKGKYEKRYRKAWPRIKRRMVRAGRHIAAGVMRQAMSVGDAALPVRPKKKHKLWKRGAAALREVVGSKQERRVRSIGAKKMRRARSQALEAPAKVGSPHESPKKPNDRKRRRRKRA